MKRGKKLLILLLALAVLSGACWAVTALTAGDDTADTAESGETVYSLEELSGITWTYGENTFTFENAGDGWFYTPDSAFDVDESFLDAIETALTQVVATKVIEEPGDLDQFGLKEPVCSVTVNGADTLSMGNTTAIGGELYFSNGDGKVYLVDSSLLECFAYELYDMVKLEDIPDLSDITSLSVTTETEALSYTYKDTSDHYRWFDADGNAADMENMETLLSNFTSLQWLECVDYNAQADALATYGLDEPAAVYTLEYTITTQVDSGTTDEDGNTVYDTTEQTGAFTLMLGDGGDDGCYAKLGDSSKVYTIDSTISTALIDVSAEALRPDDVLKLDTDTVTAVEIALDGEVYTVEQTTVESTDEDGSTTQQTVWMLGDTQIDILSVLDSITALTGDPSGAGTAKERSEEIRFTITTQTDTLELAFYQYDGTNCLVALDGETTMFLPRTDVVDIIEKVNALVL